MLFNFALIFILHQVLGKLNETNTPCFFVCIFSQFKQRNIPWGNQTLCLSPDLQVSVWCIWFKLVKTDNSTFFLVKLLSDKFYLTATFKPPYKRVLCFSFWLWDSYCLKSISPAADATSSVLLSQRCKLIISVLLQWLLGISIRWHLTELLHLFNSTLTVPTNTKPLIRCKFSGFMLQHMPPTLNHIRFADLRVHPWRGNLLALERRWSQEAAEVLQGC